MTDDATTRNDLLELLDSLETWSRACQVYSTDDREARLRQARDEVVALYFASRSAAAAQHGLGPGVTTADLAADILDARSEIADLRAKLRRCHDLLQEAESFTDCDVEWRWGAAVVAELLACDEAGECPTIAAAREGKP